MHIPQRRRIARAFRETKSLASWKRVAFEGVIIFVVTYLVFRSVYSAKEAIPELITIGISLFVALVVTPFAEFGLNYARAPLQLELELLRSSQAPLPKDSLSLAPPQTPGKVYVQETDVSSIKRRLLALKWNERDVVADVSYVGRWVRWQGKIAKIVDNGDRGYLVLVWEKPDGGNLTKVTFPATERDVVLQLDEGAWISYEGQLRPDVSEVLQVINASIVRVH